MCSVWVRIKGQQKKKNDDNIGNNFVDKSKVQNIMEGVAASIILAIEFAYISTVSTHKSCDTHNWHSVYEPNTFISHFTCSNNNNAYINFLIKKKKVSQQLYTQHHSLFSFIFFLLFLNSSKHIKLKNV